MNFSPIVKSPIAHIRSSMLRIGLFVWQKNLYYLWFLGGVNDDSTKMNSGRNLRVFYCFYPIKHRGCATIIPIVPITPILSKSYRIFRKCLVVWEIMRIFAGSKKYFCRGTDMMWWPADGAKLLVLLGLEAIVPQGEHRFQTREVFGYERSECLPLGCEIWG